VILEGDESDTPDLEAAVVSVSVDAHADPPFELSKEPWYDIEDQCFVGEDLRPIPPLEQRGLASTQSTPAQDPPRSLHSHGSSQDRINLYDNDRVTCVISEELATYTPPESENENGERWSDDNVAELEKELQRSLEGQEKVLSTSAPSSLRLYRPSTKPLHPQIDQENDLIRTSHGGLKELRRGFPLRSQDQEELQEQQQRQEAAGVEEEDDSDNEEREPQGGKQQRQDGDKEISNNNHHPEGSDCSHTTSDEDDEDPRPAKRRRLCPVPTDNALTPPEESTLADNDHYHPP
jgi:hypothetical protein